MEGIFFIDTKIISIANLVSLSDLRYTTPKEMLYHGVEQYIKIFYKDWYEVEVFDILYNANYVMRRDELWVKFNYKSIIKPHQTECMEHLISTLS